jgi:hypothetical protein
MNMAMRKRKSAMNAVRHGLTGKTLADLVAARWRLQRVRLMQAAALDLEMDRQADEIEASFVNIDEPTRVTLAFTKLANTEKSLELFHRDETTYTRQYNRTRKLLESMLETKLRNDPNTPSHPTPTASPKAIPTPIPTTPSQSASGAGFHPAGRFPIGLPTHPNLPCPHTSPNNNQRLAMSNRLP